MQDAWWKHMKQQALTNVLSNFVIEKLQWNQWWSS
jgi:hypothetical protein